MVCSLKMAYTTRISSFCSIRNMFNQNLKVNFVLLTLDLVFAVLGSHFCFMKLIIFFLWKITSLAKQILFSNKIKFRQKDTKIKESAIKTIKSKLYGGILVSCESGESQDQYYCQGKPIQGPWMRILGMCKIHLIEFQSALFHHDGVMWGCCNFFNELLVTSQSVPTMHWMSVWCFPSSRNGLKIWCLSV